jgi:hypothetical protein
MRSNMAEQNNLVILPVSCRALFRAVVRLDSRKRPAHVEAIQREIDRRAELRRAA